MPLPVQQAPSVGRVVHFHFGKEGALRTRPATIVHVWPPENHPGYTRDECNLQVMLDGRNDDGVEGAPIAEPRGWVGSAPRSNEPKAGHWSWPPFVGPR